MLQGGETAVPPEFRARRGTRHSKPLTRADAGTTQNSSGESLPAGRSGPTFRSTVQRLSPAASSLSYGALRTPALHSAKTGCRKFSLPELSALYTGGFGLSIARRGNSVAFQAGFSALCTQTVLFPVQPVTGGERRNVALADGLCQLQGLSGAVTGGKHPRNRRGHVPVDDDAAVFIGEAGNQLGDGNSILYNKDAVDLVRLAGKAQGVGLHAAGDLILPVLFKAQDPAADPLQKVGILPGLLAAADHGDGLAASRGRGIPPRRGRASHG